MLVEKRKPRPPISNDIHIVGAQFLLRVWLEWHKMKIYKDQDEEF